MILIIMSWAASDISPISFLRASPGFYLYFIQLIISPRRRLQRENKLDSQAYHLILLAQHMPGYQHLLQLVPRASSMT